MCAAKQGDSETAKTAGRRSVKNSVILGIVLMVVWLLWSGHFKDPLLVSFGVLSCLLVVWLSKRMDIADEEGAPAQLGFRPFLYAPWLIKEIVVANLDVTRRILSVTMPIRPKMIRVRASQKSDLARVIYANSITLTPGTVSVDMQDDEIAVHALTPESAEDDASGEMDRRVSKLERKD